MCVWLGKQTRDAILSLIIQGFCSAICVVFAFYFASLALTPVRILGVTQLPPGIVYTSHDMRF